MYDKPHLTYEQQLALLKERGLLCPDDATSLRLLRAVGYYRLSAYVYPFRELLGPEDKRTSPVHHRSDVIRSGTSMADVETLWRFDRKLRLILLDAIETIEIGLRTKVAHVLGKRDKFGHLDRDSLDDVACAVRRHSKNGGEREAFEIWEAKYKSLLSDAKNEDYVRHQLAKNPGDPLPIWIAVEFFDLGALVRLFSLLDKKDQNEIAKDLGVSGGPLLGAWLRDINYLRNVCAHHSRLWNRVLTYKPKKFNKAQVGSELQHVAQAGARDKIYVLLAIVAYLVTQLDPLQRWPESSLRTHIRKFPISTGLTPEGDMGFPEGWAELPLWKPIRD